MYFRCSPTLRPTIEARRNKIQARLAHISQMRTVETDLRQTHIDPTLFPRDDDSVSMEDAVLVHSPTEGSSPELADGMITGASTSTGGPVVMSTRARILASPIRVVSSSPSPA